MTMKTQDYNAIAEVPVDNGEHDKLGLGAYSDSLVSYIKNSVTPTTIAIQGDWGSGKTSLLNIVRNKLGEEYLCVSFNTWQYSQFEMSESLAISFMTHFLSELNAVLGVSENVESALETVRKVSLGIFKNVALYTAGKVGGEDIKELVQGTIDSVDSGVQGEDVIETLKTQIDECIEELLEVNNYHKIVVFIDDLDRLNPVKAVELMEAIKIFMDKEGCVYLLAVDTSVVKQGIVQKYGLDEEKSQAFFEKLIQLPFTMPVAYYDFASYVESIFPVEDGFDYSKEFLNAISKEDKEKCIAIIQMVSGRNPRAAKRIVNAFVLQEMVLQNKRLYLKKDDSNAVEVRLATAKILLALTCIQMKLEPDYNTILGMVDFFPRFLKWVKSKERIEITDLELKKRYNYSEEQIKKYNRDKNTCGKMLTIFKEWCLNYIDLYRDEGHELKNLLQATNREVEEHGNEYAPIAKIILSEFEKRLREYRKELIWNCLQEDKEKGINELWYDEAMEIWEVSKKAQTFLSHQKMLDNIVELGQALRMAGKDTEIADGVMDFYNEMESPKFKYAYSKIVRENYSKVIGYNLTKKYKKLKEQEKEIEKIVAERFWIIDVFDQNKIYSDMNRGLVRTYLSGKIKMRLKDVIKQDEIVESMFDEVWEHVGYTISNLRFVQEGKQMALVKEELSDLSSLFLIAVLLDEEETLEKYVELEKAIKKKSMEKEETVYRFICEEDIKQRRDLCRKMELKLHSAKNEKISSFITWMKKEDEKLAEYENGDIPDTYQKSRMQWYFQIVSFFVYCYVMDGCKEVAEDCRNIKCDAIKSIFNAVDIAMENYINKADASEKRNRNIFFGVTKEALAELQLAYSNEDGWVVDAVPELPFTANFPAAKDSIKEFLEMPKELLESPIGSYELGMLIGKYFVDDKTQHEESPEDAIRALLWKIYCFKQREDTFLWKYYETFGKIINQIRLNNLEVQNLLTYGKENPRKFSLRDCEQDFLCENLKKNELFIFMKDLWSQHFESTPSEEINQLYEGINWSALKSALEKVSVYYGARSVESEALDYFNTTGSLIYRDIPNFLNYLEKGTVVSGELHDRAAQARHAKFFRKYEETLQCLRDLSEN